MKQLGALSRCGLASLTLILTACGGNVEGEATGSVSQATHAWGSYHWARTTPSFDLITVNSLTSDWDAYLDQAVDDWSQSVVLNLAHDTSGDSSKKTRRQCNAYAGQVRVCNDSYGYTGWLGIAGISIDTDGHIIRGYTKLNDTYFSSSYYNTFDWKQTVICQEVGHNLGLDHQDENFDNTSLESCMDYQDPPHPYPNAHDYEQLETIYGAHTDSYDSYDTGTVDPGAGSGDGGGSGCNSPPGKGCNKGEAAWGESFGRLGRVERFARPNGDGTLEITTVTWAE